MLLKNVKVIRPKTTKIQKRNGIGYVYQVIGKSYKKDKKYTVENRKLIGKMIDEEWMIPNEYFEQYYPDVCVEQETPEFSFMTASTLQKSEKMTCAVPSESFFRIHICSPERSKTISVTVN